MDRRELPFELRNKIIQLLSGKGQRRRLRAVDLDGTFDRGVHTYDLMDKANVITSELSGSDARCVVLDLDVPHVYVTSSTKGHAHLFLNKPVTREGELEILEVLAKHGLIEQRYTESNRRRGWSAVRLPWIVKQRGAASSGH